MAYFRKRLGKWQCVIRIKGHPTTTKTFLLKKDAEVWIADNPTHLIHFNGGKFLGPYK
jgi:hypothetical protein